MASRTQAVAGVQPASRRPGLLPMWLTLKRVSRGAIIMGLVLGAYVAATALGFATAYPTQIGREQFAQTLGSNAGLQALLGPARDLASIGGFTGWRTVGVMTIVGAIWGLLTATRLFRGEEDTGRWEMVLSGETTRRRATAGALSGLAIGLIGCYILAGLAIVVIGLQSNASFTVSGSLFLSLCLICSAAMFMAIGAFMSQLAPTRRVAATWSAAIFGISLLMRMAADSVSSLDWLRWVTPLGWIEQLRPFTGSQPWVLVLIAGLVAALAIATIVLAGWRDLGSSMLRDRDSAKPHTRLLGSPIGLTLRLTRGSFIGWSVAVGAASFFTGLLAKAAASIVSDSSAGVQNGLAKLGTSPSAGATAFLGLIFFLISALIASYAASQLGASREEEAEGYADNLLVRPVSRLHWLGDRLVVTVVYLIVAAALATVLSWVGTSSQDAGVPFSKLLQAGFITLPTAIFVLGVGTFTLGLAPRFAGLAASGIIGWSFLLEMIGPLINLNHWILDLSIFHHMGLVPAVSISWEPVIIMSALGVALMLAGMYLFTKRDLAGN